GIPCSTWRRHAARDLHRHLAGPPRNGARNGLQGEKTRGGRVSLQRFRQGLQENTPRTMRILNVTASYEPFLEFGGPPVKVGALSADLAKRGHNVTVLTPDWGVEQRMAEGRIAAERSPFGWRYEAAGVTAIYLPTWLRRRALSWNPAVRRFCRARLQ